MISPNANGPGCFEIGVGLYAGLSILDPCDHQSDGTITDVNRATELVTEFPGTG